MRRVVLAIALTAGFFVWLAVFHVSGIAAAPAGMPQPSAVAQPQTAVPLQFDGNVAGPEWGGRVESTSAEDKNPEVAARALGGPGHYLNQRDRVPQDIVVSFFEREPALIDRVIFITDASELGWAPNDVEIWTSATGPASGFTKAAGATLEPNAWKPVPATTPGLIRAPDDREPLVEAGVTFPAVEARFVKVRVLRSHKADEPFFFKFRKIKVMEATAPGYGPMLTRHPEILGPLGALGSGAPAVVPPPAAPACAPAPDAPPKPGTGESRNVLHVSPRGEQSSWYVPVELKGRQAPKRPGIEALGDTSIVDRMQTTFVAWHRAQPYMLSDKAGIDTVVLELPCEGYGMSAAFKQALAIWIAAGHKLIIHDSDKCVPTPDYSFLPFRFKTDTPGALGAKGKALRILENNWMLHDRRGRPGFIDTAAWEALPGAGNELGDSNVISVWDVNLCGQMVVKNVNNIFGFVLAYAHMGRGLVIWDGLDVDMISTGWYDHVVLRELAQGFNPDNLPCAVRVGSFVLATESRLLARAVQQGQSYTYPLTLLSNLKYTGTVKLSATGVPAAAGLQARFEPAAVTVTDEQKATMTLTVPAGAKPGAMALEVKGTDTEGRTNSLCLQLGPPKNGELSVVSALSPPTKTRKNLEIILDASGSMKALMGQRSRWDTALATLQDVLAKLPDDFNVGLRIYGHREPSTSPKTCTDSELVMPIGKLDRQAIMNRARAYKPKGETPLVYSALQSPSDLKPLGGGTVVLITDGGESCKGDPVKAAAELKASGLDIRLSLVGFGVTDPVVQKDLSGFAQAGGGRFYAAQSGQALTDALLIAAIERFPYAVFDMAGKQVAAGEAGGAADELAPGDYKVVVKAGGKDLVAPRVHVTLGQQTMLKIVLKGDQLALE